jgi:hypothetical protein
MQIGGHAIVLGGAREIADRKVVVAAQLADRVQGLMNVADKVNDELERVAPSAPLTKLDWSDRGGYARARE